MPRSSVLVAGLALVAALGPACTFLVSFDTLGDAGCPDGACAGGRDATLRPDHDTVPDSHASMPADVGNCAELGEGEACAKPASCQMPATCQKGVCTPNPLPDGTTCGKAPDACHEPPACMSGVCGAPTPVAPGVVCGTAPDLCHAPPACGGDAGACEPAAELADKTPCGKAPDACHDPPECKKGVCGVATVLPESTNWNTTDPNARCCGGAPVETTSDTNCGVCGWACGSGQTCMAIDDHYLCTGCTANTDCASGCCSLSPTPSHCSPSNCAGACQSPDVCTGGSSCVVGTVDYCSY